MLSCHVVDLNNLSNPVKAFKARCSLLCFLAVSKVFMNLNLHVGVCGKLHNLKYQEVIKRFTK